MHLVRLGTSTHRGTSLGGQSSSHTTMDTFQGHGGKDEDEDEDDEEHGYEELELSQL